MRETYQPFIDRMIGRYEGGYGWNKDDPGGPTKYGITCYDLAEHRGQTMTSMTKWASLVRDMTLAEAEAIYASKYAAGLRYNDLAPGRDTVLLDYGVNSGVSRPILVCRHMFNLPGTGMTDDLVRAINAANGEKFVSDICAERLRFMHAIKGGQSWVKFGGGWQKRVDDLREYSLHLEAGGGHAAAPEPPDLSHVVLPKATNVGKTASGKTAGGMVGGAVVASQYDLPWYGIAAAVGGVLLAGIIYEAVSAHRADVANAKVHL